jgi:hypothetical protein
MKAKIALNSIFHALKENNYQRKLLYLAKIFFKTVEEPSMVGHACYPSYRGCEDHNLRPVSEKRKKKVSKTLSQKQARHGDTCL